MPHRLAIEAKEILVVDLDGTLLRTDMLYESFWSALGRDWRTPFISALALAKGRAALKQRLSAFARVDAATLPYDAAVLSYVENWRRNGRRTVLVTASDQTIARTVAEHLGLFDEVYGSDGSLNLRGESKADFLQERFGPKGFVYMGDAAADLAVWKRAAKAITINASTVLRREVERVADTVEHLTTATKSLKPYIEALRPHQWLKNTLVFLPMLAAHQFDAGIFLLELLAFLAFSIIASSVYLLNDLLDLATDRAHPRKRNRPFASGAIPIAHGTWMAAVLPLVGAGVSLTVGWNFFLVMLAYYALTTAYSLHLKRRMVIDICILAGLYTMRIMAGGAATGLMPSEWLLAFSIFFFLSLAAVKRQAEVVDNVARGQPETSGRGYHPGDLPIISMVGIGAGYVSVLVMALYVSSPNVTVLYSYPAALWAICPILLYWITRTVMVANRGGMHDDPVIYAVKDRISLICALMIFAFAVGATVL